MNSGSSRVVIGYCFEDGDYCVECVHSRGRWPQAKCSPETYPVRFGDITATNSFKCEGCGKTYTVVPVGAGW